MRHITSLLQCTLLQIMAATWLTGCSQDDIISSYDNGEEGDSFEQIVFTPMEFGKATTRGTQMTKGDITSYGVSASIYPHGNGFASAECGSYWYNEEIDAATGRSGYYWPGKEKDVSFFAYAPYGSVTIQSRNDLGYPVYSYTVPSAIASQVDFITANVLNHSGAGITEPVPLTFAHQCSDIRFLVYNQGSSDITVHSISIKGVKYSGTFSNDTWTLNNTVNTASLNPFMLTAGVSGTAVAAGETEDITGTDNHFIMLPQTVAAGTAIFDVDATVNGTRSNYVHELPAALVLLAGKTYTFTLTLGESVIIVDTATDIADWEVEVTYLEIGTETVQMEQPGLQGSQNTDEGWERTIETNTINPNSTTTVLMNQHTITGSSGVTIPDWIEEDE